MTTMRGESAGGADLTRLYAPEVERFLLGAVARLRAEPGSYLTLSQVGTDRREKQLARLPPTWRQPVGTWVERQLRLYQSPIAQQRFRLRLWERGGRAAGGVTFTVTYPGKPAVLPPPEPEVQPSAQEIVDLKARLDQLEGMVGQRSAPAEVDPAIRAALDGLRADVDELQADQQEAEAAILKIHELHQDLEKKYQILFNAFIKHTKSLR